MSVCFAKSNVGESPQMSGMFRHPFGHAFRDDGYDFSHWHGCGPYDDAALPANVRNMCALSATIRAKSNWWSKAQDPGIRARWREEAISTPVLYGNISLTEDEVSYVLDELAWYASRRDEETGIEASIFQRIWQSDTLVDDALHAELLRAVAKLEDIPEDQKDWHPRADGQVLDLVHPSLYCIVYDRTTLRDGYDPTLPPSAAQFKDIYKFCSERFCWLPTDFAISKDGAAAKALGYINNLDPRLHASAYPVVERLVARFVPLWERVLAESRVDLGMRCLVHGNYWWGRRSQSNSQSEGSNDGSGSGESYREITRTLHLPGVNVPFQPYPDPEPVYLKGCTLQVIIKLANIILTPSKPQYPGGSWHVEGMLDEAIVSTGIYYYNEENTTDSALAFRMAVSEPYYNQSDDEGMQAVYGLENEGPLNQHLGSVVTKQGRCIAFPNVYQHQVQPFELVEKSRPGHRKIVALFLVDPALPKPRISTSNVPPQQKEWMKALLQDIAAEQRVKDDITAKGLGKLPVEMVDMIIDQADWLMSRQEAEELRLELMDERSAMTEDNDELVFSVPFNLCEH